MSKTSRHHPGARILQTLVLAALALALALSGSLMPATYSSTADAAPKVSLSTIADNAVQAAKAAAAAASRAESNYRGAVRAYKAEQRKVAKSRRAVASTRAKMHRRRSAHLSALIRRQRAHLTAVTRAARTAKVHSARARSLWIAASTRSKKLAAAAAKARAAARAAEGGSTAAGRKCLTLGIGSNYQWRVNAANGPADLPSIRRDGITAIREDIYWHLVQPNSASDWNWHQYDQLFTMASQQGITVLPIIDQGTVWASAPASYHDMPATVAGRKAYARYAAAVVLRYGPSGTFWRANRQLNPKPFTAVELWNEPWNAAHPVSVKVYVNLLLAAGAAIKRVAPTVTVLANVDDRWTWMTDTKFHIWGQAVLEYAAKLAPVIEGWAIHPYSEGQWNGNAPAQDAMRQMNWLQQQLISGHVPGRIWVTEIGFSTAATAPYSASVAYQKFLTSALAMTGPNAPQHVWVFTSSRPTPQTKPGSWDYGYNLVGSTGSPSAQLASIGSARCDP